jgi:hypothetical protein
VRVLFRSFGGRDSLKGSASDHHLDGPFATASDWSTYERGKVPVARFRPKAFGM